MFYPRNFFVRALQWNSSLIITQFTSLVGLLSEGSVMDGHGLLQKEGTNSIYIINGIWWLNKKVPINEIVLLG